MHAGDDLADRVGLRDQPCGLGLELGGALFKADDIAQRLGQHENPLSVVHGRVLLAFVFDIHESTNLVGRTFVGARRSESTSSPLLLADRVPSEPVHSLDDLPMRRSAGHREGVETMANSKKVTSPRAAKAASRVLRDGRTSKTSKTAAGSALAQTPRRRKKR